MRLFSTNNIRASFTRNSICAILLLAFLFGGIGMIALAPTTTHAGAVGDFTRYLFGTTVGDALFGGILDLISQGAQFIANYFMIAGALLLDESIKYSITSENFNFAALQTAWGTVRDVANMTFIFILLYIGIATILQLGGFQTKRLLITLIIVALLVNFSFFLAGVVIDTGNILAVSLYNTLTSDGTRTISEQFALSLNIKTIFNADQLKTLSYGDTALARFGIAGIFFLLFFIFLFAAILFILRTLYLIFVLLLSPLALAAAAIPGTASYFKKWLHYLINYSFVAPAYLFLLLIVLQIIPDMFGGTQSRDQSLAAAFSSDPTLNIFLGFILVGGLLIGALVVARNMAGEAANLSVKWSGKLTGMALDKTAWGLRQTAGRAGAMMGNSKWLAEKEEGGKLGGFAARMALKTGRWTGKQNFDVRGLGLTQAAAGGLGTSFGGPGGKGGFSAAEKRRRESQVEFGEHLENIAKKPSKQERGKEEYLQKMITYSMEQDDTNAEQNFRTRLIDLYKERERRGIIRKRNLGDRLGRSKLFSLHLEADQAAGDELRRDKTDFDKLLKRLGQAQQQSSGQPPPTPGNNP